uniref:Secreted protein n=1 Tax=Trypanosoma vivax (strain Y486) TaxID=1055687 RepID=G0TTE9_TRYVY|nr:hypothetical protein TVY486_0304060 [Trypanosoma vivax Y486]
MRFNCALLFFCFCCCPSVPFLPLTSDKLATWYRAAKAPRYTGKRLSKRGNKSVAQQVRDKGEQLTSTKEKCVCVCVRVWCEGGGSEKNKLEVCGNIALDKELPPPLVAARN